MVIAIAPRRAAFERLASAANLIRAARASAWYIIDMLCSVAQAYVREHNLLSQQRRFWCCPYAQSFAPVFFASLFDETTAPVTTARIGSEVRRARAKYLVRGRALAEKVGLHAASATVVAATAPGRATCESFATAASAASIAWASACLLLSCHPCSRGRKYAH